MSKIFLRHTLTKKKKPEIKIPDEEPSIYEFHKFQSIQIRFVPTSINQMF